MSESSAPAPINLGFLTIVTEGPASLGGYLVTNFWGRPLEFRLSTAVQPNKVQQILYGPTLSEYLGVDVIGKTLIERTSSPIHLLCVDSVLMLAMRKRLEVPVVAIIPGDDARLPLTRPGELESLNDSRSSVPLLFDPQLDPTERIRELLIRVDSTVDLGEPFARIREAMGEARKLGVVSRAA